MADSRLTFPLVPRRRVIGLSFKVDERSQLAVLGIEMFAQLGMLGDHGVHRLADRRSRNVYRSLLADVLA